MAEVRLTLKLESGNAAFDESPAQEVADIISGLARNIREGREGKFALHDTNGNKVGTAFLEIWDEAADE